IMPNTAESTFTNEKEEPSLVVREAVGARNQPVSVDKETIRSLLSNAQPYRAPDSKSRPATETEIIGDLSSRYDRFDPLSKIVDAVTDIPTPLQESDRSAAQDLYTRYRTDRQFTGLLAEFSEGEGNFGPARTQLQRKESSEP